jgi:hypothetical protein
MMDVLDGGLVSNVAQDNWRYNDVGLTTDRVDFAGSNQ